MDQQLYSQAVWFISRLDKRYAINKGVGWVYALRNSEFRRPLLKIGMTTKPPFRAHAYTLGRLLALQQRLKAPVVAQGVPGGIDSEHRNGGD